MRKKDVILRGRALITTPVVVFIFTSLFGCSGKPGSKESCEEPYNEMPTYEIVTPGAAVESTVDSLTIKL